MDEKQSTAHMAEAYVKEKAFDNPSVKILLSDVECQWD